MNWTTGGDGGLLFKISPTKLQYCRKVNTNAENDGY
jgi:hypothetical protein